MARIEDVIVKTLLCAEMSIGTACRMFVPFRGNCFGRIFHFNFFCFIFSNRFFDCLLTVLFTFGLCHPLALKRR